MKKVILLFTYLFLNGGFSSEPLDIETLPTLRTKQYSMGPYNKIVVFSAPRTASTLTYNICRFLFEDQAYFLQRHNEFNPKRNVLKTHKKSNVDSLKGDKVLYVVPIRHPMDAALSQYRVRVGPITNLRIWCENEMGKQIQHLTHIETMQTSGEHILLVRYEDFQKNFDHLLDCLETHLSISISPQDKETIRTGYSQENVYQNTLHLTNFRSLLPASGFHGNHVSLRPYEIPKAVFDCLQDNFHQAELLFLRFGFM